MNCNCLALRQATRRVTQHYDHALAPAGLRATQLPLLAMIAGRPEITMKELAAHLVLDRATVGHNLGPLEAQGLVRITAGHDRRERRLSLTDAGIARLHEALDLWRTAQAHFETVFGVDRARDLRTLMGEIASLDLAAAAA